MGMKDPGTLLDQLMMVKQIKGSAFTEKPYERLEHICE
jgi:hypothetical protein